MVIPCGGTYSYFCSMHPSMTGSITASCTTPVEEIHAEAPLIYPNPFRDKINICFHDLDKIGLYNILGKKMVETQPAPGVYSASLNTEDLPAGIYILSFYQDGIRVESRKMLKQ